MPVENTHIQITLSQKTVITLSITVLHTFILPHTYTNTHACVFSNYTT